MAYRFMSCSACGTRLRFLRRVERPSIECPLCGNVMDLVPKDMIPRSDCGGAAAVSERIVPEPEVVPQEVIEAKNPRRRSRLRSVFDYLRLRQFFVGSTTGTGLAIALLRFGIIQT